MPRSMFLPMIEPPQARAKGFPRGAGLGGALSLSATPANAISTAAAALAQSHLSQGGGAPFDLAAALATAELYMNPTAAKVDLSGSTLQRAHFSGTVPGHFWCTANGNIQWNANALGTGLPGLVLGGADSGHNYLYAENPGATDWLYSPMFMGASAFWIGAVVWIDSISTNNAAHVFNDRVIGTAQSNFGMALRSTPVLQGGGDTGLGQITVEGPAVVTGRPTLLLARKDATKLYLSVDGGAEVAGDMGDCAAGSLNDILVMGYSDQGGVGFAGKLGETWCFKVPPASAIQANIKAAIKTKYAIA